MAKNYFTDEQVKDIAHKVDGYGLVEGGIFLSEHELKALMNLAVETAIGEPQAFYHNEYPSERYGDLKEFAHDFGNTEQALPLYSVKELEN